MKRILYLLVLTLISSFAIGESEIRTVDLSSPRKTVKSHLELLQDNNWYPKLSANTLNFPKGTAKKEKKILAIKLKQIYDGLGHKLDVNQMPIKPDYRHSTGEYRYFPDTTDGQGWIYLERVNGRWLYSQETVSQINLKHKEVYPFGTYKLLGLMASHGSKKYLGLKGFQYVGILLLIIFGFLGFKIFTFFFERVLIRIINRFGRKKFRVELIRPVAKPLSLMLVFSILSLLVPVLQFEISVGQYVIRGVRACVPFFGMLVFYRLVDVLTAYLMGLAEKTESTLDDQLVPLLRKALKTFVVIIGILFILANLDFNITAILAGVSIGGLAIALAAQDMLKNFFGSLMIFIDRPFQIGDWVVGPDIDGDVEEVGFRTTRVRTFHNSLISVPNGKLADMTIDNYGKRRYRRYKTYIGVTYDTAPEKIDEFVEGLKMVVEAHPKTRKDYYNIYCNTFNSSSIDILFYIFFEVPSWPMELQARHEINLEIMKLAKKLGVDFAFPTQTLHVESFPTGDTAG